MADCPCPDPVNYTGPTIADAQAARQAVLQVVLCLEGNPNIVPAAPSAFNCIDLDYINALRNILDLAVQNSDCECCDIFPTTDIVGWTGPLDICCFSNGSEVLVDVYFTIDYAPYEDRSGDCDCWWDDKTTQEFKFLTATVPWKECDRRINGEAFRAEWETTNGDGVTIDGCCLNQFNDEVSDCDPPTDEHNVLVQFHEDDGWSILITEGSNGGREWSRTSGGGACGSDVFTSSITGTQNCNGGQFVHVDPNPELNECTGIEGPWCRLPNCLNEKSPCGDCGSDPLNVGWCIRGNGWRVVFTLVNNSACSAITDVSPQYCDNGCNYWPWSGYQCIDNITGAVCYDVPGGIGTRLNTGVCTECANPGGIWVCHEHFDEIVTAALNILNNCCCGQTVAGGGPGF